MDKLTSNEKLYEEAINLARGLKVHGSNKEIFKMMKEEAYS